MRNIEDFETYEIIGLFLYLLLGSAILVKVHLNYLSDPIEAEVPPLSPEEQQKKNEEQQKKDQIRYEKLQAFLALYFSASREKTITLYEKNSDYFFPFWRRKMMPAKKRFEQFQTSFPKDKIYGKDGVTLITDPQRLKARQEAKEILETLIVQIGDPADPKNQDYSILPEFYHVSKRWREILESGYITSADILKIEPTFNSTGAIFASILPEFRESYYGQVGFAFSYKNYPHLNLIHNTHPLLSPGTYYRWVYISDAYPLQLFSGSEAVFGFMICQNVSDYVEVRKFLDKQQKFSSIKVLTVSELNEEQFTIHNQNKTVPNFSGLRI